MTKCLSDQKEKGDHKEIRHAQLSRQQWCGMVQVAGRTKSLFSTMNKLLRLDSIESGGRAKQEVHDILASRCVVTPHPDLPPEQAEDLARQVSALQEPCLYSRQALTLKTVMPVLRACTMS